jgi:hypothetical protein
MKDQICNCPKFHSGKCPEEELKKDENRCCENGFFGDKHTCMKEELKKEWRSKIGELVGEASMCWSELPGGVFESERAKRIVDDIMLILAKQQEEFVKMIDKHNSLIRARLKYCLDQNGMPHCKNCGLNAVDDLLADIKSKLK